MCYPRLEEDAGGRVHDCSHIFNSHPDKHKANTTKPKRSTMLATFQWLKLARLFRLLQAFQLFSHCCCCCSASSLPLCSLSALLKGVHAASQIRISWLSLKVARAPEPRGNESSPLRLPVTAPSLQLSHPGRTWGVVERPRCVTGGGAQAAAWNLTL